ncbi:MAG: hypothetical protein HY721_31730 [Planctomycetes bacterium]|nr:hypothetical protein [Planctomycetota bacterium]
MRIMLWGLLVSLGLVFSGCDTEKKPEPTPAPPTTPPAAATTETKPATPTATPTAPPTDVLKTAVDTAKSTAAAALPAMEVGCGKCVYNIAGVTACEAAVKVGDKALLLSVPGFDAHKEGLCAGPPKAVITGGKEEGGKYVATKVELQK